MAWTERYVRADAAGGGNGTTNTNSGVNGAFTLAEAITDSTTHTGTRYNIVQAGGTFSPGSTQTFSGNGTTTAPNWWRGCNSSAGDIDTNNALTKPIISLSTSQVSVTGIHQIFSNIDFQAASTSEVMIASSAATGLWIHRCRFTNTGANSASRAATFNGGYTVSESYFSASSSAAVVISCGSDLELVGCYVTGGGVGVSDPGNCVSLFSNVIRACGSHGYEMTNIASPGRPRFIVNNTIRGNGGDGIKFSTAPTIGTMVMNNLILSNGGWGINNATGTNTNMIHRLGNDFGTGAVVNTSGKETGFGDSPSLSELSESSDPNTSSTDMSLVSGAAAKAGAQPGAFENQSYTSYLDVGAVQRQEPAGGGLGAQRTLAMNIGTY